MTEMTENSFQGNPSALFYHVAVLNKTKYPYFDQITA